MNNSRTWRLLKNSEQYTEYMFFNEYDVIIFLSFAKIKLLCVIINICYYHNSMMTFHGLLGCKYYFYDLVYNFFIILTNILYYTLYLYLHYFACENINIRYARYNICIIMYIIYIIYTYIVKRDIVKQIEYLF